MKRRASQEERTNKEPKATGRVSHPRTITLSQKSESIKDQQPQGEEEHRESLLPAAVVRALSEAWEADAAVRQKWLDDNKPRFLNLLNPTSSEPELHRLVWETIKDSSFLIPKPGTSWRDYAAPVLRSRLSRVLYHLTPLAIAGDKEAVEALASAAIEAVAVISNLAQTKPELLRPFARKQRRWPVFKSTHLYFGEDEDAVMKLLDKLQQGEDCPIKIAGGRWNPKDTLGEIALKIFDRFEATRVSQKLFPLIHSSHFDSKIFGLSDFGPTTWPLWAEVAESYVKAHYSSPRAIEFLNALLDNSQSKRDPTRSRLRKTRINPEVFHRLRDRLRSMAGENKQ